jgi:Ig-like domain from next to BRCA1 gene
MLKFRLIIGFQVLMIGALLLSACGATPAELTPSVTINPDEIRTQAVGTFAADLTLTAFVAVTNTPIATITPLATFTVAPTTGGVAVNTVPPTASCYGLSFVSDVTIPDNTPVTPGQAFTKTWKVKNAGSCAWDAGFKFVFTGGEQMGGATVTLPSAVAAGAVYDISVPLTAPNKSGTLRGNWRMQTGAGQFFGDEVYVQVVVGGGAAATNTGAAATSTTSPATNTVTATPTQ